MRFDGQAMIMAVVVLTGASVSAVHALGGAEEGNGAAAVGQPSEKPPASYAGAYYVDRAGCVFARAGEGWDAQMGWDGKPVCGYPPSLSDHARLAQVPAVMPQVSAPQGLFIVRAQTIPGVFTTCPNLPDMVQRYVISDGRVVLRCSSETGNPVEFINRAGLPTLHLAGIAPAARPLPYSAMLAAGFPPAHAWIAPAVEVAPDPVEVAAPTAVQSVDGLLVPETDTAVATAPVVDPAPEATAPDVVADLPRLEAPAGGAEAVEPLVQPSEDATGTVQPLVAGADAAPVMPEIAAQSVLPPEGVPAPEALAQAQPEATSGLWGNSTEPLRPLVAPLNDTQDAASPVFSGETDAVEKVQPLVAPLPETAQAEKGAPAGLELGAAPDTLPVVAAPATLTPPAEPTAQAALAAPQLAAPVIADATPTQAPPAEPADVRSPAAAAAERSLAPPTLVPAAPAQTAAKPEAPEEPAAKPAAAPSEGRLVKGAPYVQIGAFGLAANADRVVARLRALDLPVVTTRSRIGGKMTTVVYSGPFDSRSDAGQALTTIRRNGFGDAILR